MGILKCNNDGCAYNHADRCMTAVLGIGKSGQCESFRESTKTKRVRDAEFAADLSVEGRDISSVIDCYSTDCMFNQNTHCNAGSVDMKDGLFFTRCKTKIKE